jgi:hypothetical protein
VRYRTTIDQRTATSRSRRGAALETSGRQIHSRFAALVAERTHSAAAPFGFGKLERSFNPHLLNALWHRGVASIRFRELETVSGVEKRGCRERGMRRPSVLEMVAPTDTRSASPVNIKIAEPRNKFAFAGVIFCEDRNALSHPVFYKPKLGFIKRRSAMASPEIPNQQDDSVHGSRCCPEPCDDQPFPDDRDLVTPSLIDNWIDA